MTIKSFYNLVETKAEDLVDIMNTNWNLMDQFLDKATDKDMGKEEIAQIKQIMRFGMTIRTNYPRGKETPDYWLNLIKLLNKAKTIKEIKEVSKQAGWVRPK